MKATVSRVSKPMNTGITACSRSNGDPEGGASVCVAVVMIMYSQRISCASSSKVPAIVGPYSTVHLFKKTRKAGSIHVRRATHALAQRSAQMLELRQISCKLPRDRNVLLIARRRKLGETDIGNHRKSHARCVNSSSQRDNRHAHP